MASERLTDSELDEALAYAQGLHSLRLTAAVAELKELRASAVPTLTEEEREALVHTIDDVSRMDGLDDDAGPKAREVRKRAIALLERLTGIATHADDEVKS